MRSLSSLNGAQLTSGIVRPVYFVSLTFNSGPIYACTAPFDFTWGGQTWQGVGELGGVGTVTESTEVVATGTTVTLHNIDNAILQDSLNDIGALLPASIAHSFNCFQLLFKLFTFLTSEAAEF